MKFILFFITLFITVTYTSSSQFLSGKNTQILLKGVVVEENDNSPVSVAIEMRTSDGKKIKTQSVAGTGLFEQLLPAGESYTVILTGDDILRKEFMFRTDEATEYKEQKTQWTVIKPKPGSRVFSGKIFVDGNSTITEEGKSQLKDLQMLLRFNRSLFVDFQVSGDGNNNLSKERMHVLNKLIESWSREKARIEINQAEKASAKDLFVYITKIEEFLNK